MSAPSDIVVTGRGVVSSIGEGADEFFDALLAKKSGIADGIGAATEFDPEVAMSAKDVRRSDRYTHFAVAAAAQAAVEANVPDGVDVDRLGVLVGTGVGGLQTLEDRYEIQIADGRLKSIATVGDAVNLVQELVREKEGVSA